jgi:O-antigen biosynthesis protein
VEDADPQARIEELEATVERLERSLEHSRQLLNEAQITAQSLAVELDRATSAAERVRGRRAVRMAIRAADRLRPAVRMARRAASAPRRAVRAVRRGLARTPSASRSEEESLVQRIRSGEPPKLAATPLVSIVILHRNGRAMLERCLRGLARTTYPSFEVILVDNGSSDGSADMAERLGLALPLTVIRNEGNPTYSEANGQGIARAKGDFVCLLNNDVDPITEHWLGYLVETALGTGAAAVGARLIYPRARGGPRAGWHFRDLSLQHAGVTFDRSAGMPMPQPLGAGEDPMSALATTIAERPALTAACLLLRRDAYLAAGGFSTAYRYGMEDVDLCLRLRAAGGRLVYDGRAALWHHESATRAADRGAYSARAASNRATFVDTWGPALSRWAFLDALEGRHELSDAPLHVGITITTSDPSAGAGDLFTARELGGALERFGWRVSYLERREDAWYRPDPSLDVVVVLLDACDIRRLPRHALTVAWIRNWPERWLARPWFDEYDLVFGSSTPIVDLVRERSAKVASLLPLATEPRRFAAATSSAERACDVLFVGNYWHQERDVVDALPALARRGLAVRVHGRGWDAVPGFAELDRGFLPYESIAEAYASARVVVDDAAGPTRARGSVNSRVFDALAAGAVVVSSGEIGVHGLFDAEFPTWSDASSLQDLVDDILANRDGYRERAASYRERVLAEHTYDVRAATLRAALRDWATARRIAIRVGIPNWEVAATWGDYHFGRALQRSLERAGHPCRLQLLPEWPNPVSAREDVAIHLFGRSQAPTRAGQVNLLWQISHPDESSPDMYERYDHVFVASDLFAERMAPLVRVPVTALHQATDPERFRPDPTGPHHELLLVANSRRVRRRIVDALAGTAHDLAVYGAAWTPDLIDPRFVRGEHIPNSTLARYYSSADIVLNDHWDDMRAQGFISNRIYDALAAGGFVISDEVDGIDAEFGGAVPVFHDRQELEALVERYLPDPIERRRLADLGRAVVLERHTFDLRRAVILSTAMELLAGRASSVGSAAVPPPSVAVR